jgi:hypothetical protein
MRRIPHAREVDRALVLVRAETTRALKELNATASQAMAKGEYAPAAELAAKGREIQQFQAEVEVLRKRWRELRGSGGTGPKESATPLWGYYQPILKALVQAGGKGNRKDLEQRVVLLLGSEMLPADHEPRRGGHERWQLMVSLARKHLAAEGWIEKRQGPIWRITEAGRRAAESPTGGDTTDAK